ncbi:MAG: PAS domain S-box protein, partial [Nitrospirota bacterium]
MNGHASLNEPGKEFSGFGEHYETLFNNLPVGLAYITPEMRYVRINPYMEEKLGILSADIAGRHCYDLIGMYKDDPLRQGEQRICDDCGVRTTLATGEPRKFTRKARDNFIIENFSFPIKDTAGKISGAVEIIFDITERVALEERLQKYASELESAVEEKTHELKSSKVFLDNVIESTPDAIFTLDKNGRITYINPAAEEIFGYMGRLLLGKPITAIVAQPDQDKVERALALAE